MKLILASNSPRRKELLSTLPYKFEIIPSVCNEVSTSRLPKDICVELACRKAMSVYASNPDCVVIGCDTVVDLKGELMGKPKDEADAYRMLNELSGRDHFVHSGVCVVYKNGVWLFRDTTQVTFKQLTQKEVDRYIKSGSALDKAGAYGIQDSGFVTRIGGDYNNVMGFPLDKVAKILQSIYKR